jgi:hypothetical protein
MVSPYGSMCCTRPKREAWWLATNIPLRLFGTHQDDDRCLLHNVLNILYFT